MEVNASRQTAARLRAAMLGLRTRARSIRDARRSLTMTNVEGVLALQDEAQRHIAEGTLVMGRESYYAPEVRKYKGDTGRVFIGNFASVAHDAVFYSGGLHRTEWVSQYGLRAMLDLPGAYEDGFPHGDGDIHVGHDTWITRGVVVMSGVTIGPGAVVATRSVVTKDVAPYAIVGGIPAKQIGQRFTDDQIAALLRIAWWDWPLETIRERVAELCSPDIDAFIASHDPGAPDAPAPPASQAPPRTT
jgi:acetyltransferase-like isoleucine patch superfamily enzyme